MRPMRSGSSSDKEPDQDSQWNDEMPALLEHRADRFSFPFPGSCQTESWPDAGQQDTVRK